MADLDATLERVLMIAERRRAILRALHEATDRADWPAVVACSRELRGLDGEAGGHRTASGQHGSAGTR